MKKNQTIFFIICCSFILQQVTSLYAYDDPNEPGVADDRDFRKSTVQYVQSTADISADVIFYHPSTISNGAFWFYISTDNNNVENYGVRCYSTGFSIHKFTSSSPGPAIYSGTPTIYRGKYSLKVPIKALGLTKGPRNTMRKIHYWFFWLAGGGSDADRLPDSGTLELKIQP